MRVDAHETKLELKKSVDFDCLVTVICPKSMTYYYPYIFDPSKTRVHFSTKDATFDGCPLLQNANEEGNFSLNPFLQSFLVSIPKTKHREADLQERSVNAQTDEV
ncbi:hypothetical protein N8T08_005073 [Aspergillus melleus]|uniref:Uncharacterized protein n=1 Tax=Aspergillus melleus TaxID=138277 RepID=A0ACC3BFX5_9EURO|nr:hypothetical protein N8T08_005073 [Aspergillus melleus]